MCKLLYGFLTSALLVICSALQAQSNSKNGDDGVIITGIFGEGGQSNSNKSCPTKDKDKEEVNWFHELFKWAQDVSNFLYNTGPKTNSVESFDERNYRKEDLDKENFMVMNMNHSGSSLSLWLGAGISRQGVTNVFGPSKENISIYYLRIPELKLRYSASLVNGMKVFVDFGPYYAIALGGSSKFGGATTSLKFGSTGADSYKRGDYGVQLIPGIQLKNSPLSLGLVADLGLRNIYPTKAFKVHNHSYGIMIGYNLK